MTGYLRTSESRVLRGQIWVVSQPSYGDSSLNALQVIENCSFFSARGRQIDNFAVPVLAHSDAAHLQDKFAKLFESAQIKGTENTQDC